MSCQPFQSCFRIFVCLVSSGGVFLFILWWVFCLFVWGFYSLFIHFVCFIGNFPSIFSECSFDCAGLGPCYRAELQLGEYFHILALKSWMEQRISYNTGAFQLFALG